MSGEPVGQRQQGARGRRCVGSTQPIAHGDSDEEALRDVAAAWHDWARDPDAVFVVTHGELIARPRS